MIRRTAVDWPLRILMTTDVVGGVWDFCWTLAAELTRRSHEVTLLALGRPSEEHCQAASSAGVHLISAPLKLEWMRDSERDVVQTRILVDDLVRSLDADVLHASQYAAATVRSDVPIVLTAHSDTLSWLKWNTAGWRGKPPPEWRDYAELVRQGLTRADEVVAVSRFVAEEMSAIYGVPREMDVIHNGWPLSGRAWTPPSRRQRLTVLGGRVWDGAKNVGLVGEAARGQGLGRIVLFGDQRHPDTDEVIAVDPPIDAVGWQTRRQVDSWLGRARICLAPARYEPFGLLPLQGALSGSALLLSDIPTFRELWDGAGLFFHRDDPDDLRRQWIRLLEDDVLADSLGEQARARARRLYTIDRMTEAYLRRYVAAAVRRGAQARQAVPA